jgi:nitrite reductase/ring-hydroxylating ferredoxin subunit/uncharacterized membrane protein
MSNSTGGGRWLLREEVADKLAKLSEIDRIAEPAQGVVRKLVPQESVAKDALSGSWLGHPLHPLLTDLVVGCWVSAWLLDLLGGERETAADDLVGLGVLAAAPTAVAGLSDWAELGEGPRRVGMVHGLGNSVAITLHAGSWFARRAGRRTTGVALSTLGLAVAGASAWLGGHLSFAQGVGVDQTAFEDPPTTWTRLTDDDRLEEGQLVRRSAAGTGVLLVRYEGSVHALIDRCSHRGCSLSEGALDGDEVVCPCHGSRFRLDGRLIKGPATGPQPTLETRVRDGKIEVRAAEA